MDQWHQKMRARPSAPAPRLQHVATLFRVRGKTGRAIRCAVYLVATSTELRLEYESDEELLRSQLFVVHDGEAIAALADDWHAALLEKGFNELAIL